MQGAEEGRALDPASATSSDASFDVAESRPPDRFRWIRHDPMLVVEVGLVVLLVVLAWRLQWIADDGYIYLTHVQNWVENGAGPNLNVGERVEGYTSVGWFVLLSIGDLLRPHGLLSLEQLTILVGLVLTAAAAVLAMIPLSRSVFWGPMAVAIMGGLIVATVLTLLALPAMYAAWYRVRPGTAAAG